MKVIVCFGKISVVVPCGSGNLTISELQEKACSRYRRALNKDSNYYVHIFQLKSEIGNGIYDADDLVGDVAEDKEKIVAIYEEESFHSEFHTGYVSEFNGKVAPHQSSTHLYNHKLSTEESEQKHLNIKKEMSISHHRRDASLEIDVGTEALKTNSRVMVRTDKHNSRDSKLHSPSCLQNDCGNVNGSFYDPRSNVPLSLSSTPIKSQGSNIMNNKPLTHRKLNSKDQNFFRRDATVRQSMGSGLSETTDELSVYNAPPTLSVYHPSSIKSDEACISLQPHHNGNVQYSSLPWFYRDSQEITFVNDGKVEALKVGSFIDYKSRKFAGLLVLSVDQSSCIAEDNLLTQGDVIVGVNEHMLMDFVFEDAEAMMMESLKYPHVQFRVLPVEEKERNKSLSLPSDFNPMLDASLSKFHSKKSPNQIYSSTSSLSTQNSHSPKINALPKQLGADTVNRYTKRIGNRITVQLKKDIQGLGFTLTSRDTTIGGPGPIYIKQILPVGSAVKSGKLQLGDRLLEVNGEGVVGKTQQEAVSLLRAIPIGSAVNITISRQSENLPRKLDNPEANLMINDDNMKEYFVLEIALNDTGSAGLGISLKGNQNTKTGKDMGIFVKKVFHGGAAWQDGRLQANDQLIEVNGHSLREMTNQEAIDFLRSSMSIEANILGQIQMVVARHRKSLEASLSECNSELSDLTFDHNRPIIEAATVTKNNEQNSASQVVNAPTITRRLSSDLSSQSTDKSKSNDNPDVLVCDDDFDSPVEGYEPFSREATVRQSISEKRRDLAAKLPKSNNEPSKVSKKHPKNDLPKTPAKLIFNKEQKLNGKVATTLKFPKVPLDLSKAQVNNNNSKYSWKVPQPLRKSVSTDSLLTDKKGTSKANHNKHLVLNRNRKAIGPSLVIAKSSSLESLQIAMAAQGQVINSAFSKPLPFTKAARGRVLNNSFRAALDQTSDPPQQCPTLEKLSEIANSPHSTAPSSDDSTKNSKKRNKILNIFKPKPKTSETYKRRSHSTDPGKKRGDLNEDKRKLNNDCESRQVTKDSRSSSTISDEYNKHKTRRDSRDRSRGTSREERQDPFQEKTKRSDLSHHTLPGNHSKHKERHSDHMSDNIDLSGSPIKRNRKREKEKSRPPNSLYSSLPRQSRRESEPKQAGTIIQVASSFSDEKILPKQQKNFEFYNRHKPSGSNHQYDVIRHSNEDSVTDIVGSTTLATLISTENSRPCTNRSRRTQRDINNDLFHNSSSILSFYQRQESPQVPEQSYFAVQNNNGSPDPVVVRRVKTNKQNQPTNVRHSIFTEQPSNYRYQASPSTSGYSSNHDRSWLHVTNEFVGSDGITDNNRSSSTPDSVLADRNRRAFYKLMSAPRPDGVVEKIEVSVPYNL